MIPSSHPYWHMRAVLDRRSDVRFVTCSYYTYTPRSVNDTRTCFNLSFVDFQKEELIAEIMQKVPAGQELAIHSNIQLLSGEAVHFVMLDMSTSAKAHLEKLKAFLGGNLFEEIVWYQSGRSFHGYGHALLSQGEWVKFMGLLLLANQPKLEPTVDPRWIGHRLLAGYAALRWTKNTDYYVSTPVLLEKSRRG